VLFSKAPPPGQVNAPPTSGLLFFGHVRVDGRTGTMTVTHRDLSGAVLHTTELTPQP
jgi:alkaline phosphatase D